MEPRIQYAKTADAVNIAYWTLGEGKPLVHMPWAGVSHLQLDWQFPEYRWWYERLADGRRLVRYDARGTGLSDRDPPRFSLDAYVLDTETIVDHLQIERFALFGLLHSAPVAIAYAARHPERVSHLILWCPYASESDYLRSSPQLQALRQVAATDWETYMELAANLSLGWSEGAEARRWSAYTRECYTQEMWQRIVGVASEFDVANLLSQITAPTLVLHRRQAAFPTVEVARRLAAEIPDARFTLLDGTSIVPFLGGAEAILANIDEFLGDGHPAESLAPARPEPLAGPSGTAIILFADIADSTALTERLGDAAFREKARNLDTTLRSAIREHDGMPIEGKLLGDGVLATFASAKRAIEAALACGRAGSEAGLPLHLGLHAGDVIREEHNVYGGAVNIAARISALSATGEVLVSETVRSLGRTSAAVRFEDRGEHALKGVGEPVRLFAVRWQEEA